MSRLSRMASETPVYFPSIVSASSDSKFTPIPPQKGRHHPKKHQHGNDSRIQLEPLRPSTAGERTGRMSISLSSEQVGLEAKIMDGSSTAAENIGKFCDMEKKIQFYRQLASLKLRDVVTTEESVLKTIDMVINACALALDADYVVLYSLNEATHMLSVTSCSKSDVVGFQVPLDKFAMEAVLQSVHQQLVEDDNQRCSVEPVYVANLQVLGKYDLEFDVDSPAGTTTNSILASVIVDENGKPIFVVEARCTRQTLFSDSIFRAGIATLENIVYQYDLKQYLARTIDSYASLDAFLQDAIMQPAVQEENDDDENNPDALQVASDELTSGVDRETDPELEGLLAEKSPNLKKLAENFLTRSKSDGVCLIKFNPAKESCQVLASAALGTKIQLLDTDKLATLFTSTSAGEALSENGAEPVLPMLQRFIESIEKAHPLDLSDDQELRSAMSTQDDFKTLVFIPVPSSSSCTFVGLLLMSKAEQHEYDVRMLRPFASALGLAIVMKKKNDDMHTSTMQKLKLIHLYNSHFEIETINDPSTLVNMICEIGCQTFNTGRVTLYVADPIKSELWSLSTLGSVNGLRIPYGVGIAGTVAKTKQKLIVRNAYDDPRFDRSFDIKFGFKTDSLITFPVLDKNGETLGVIQAVNTRHFMESDAHPLIAKFDERVLDVFNHMVSYALRINSSLIMFAKVQADYWVNRAVMGDSKNYEDGSSAKNDVASVHSLLDISGFDESKRVPRNKWSTFAYACWVLGKFLLAGYRKRHESRINCEHSKWRVDDLKVGSGTDEFAASRSRSRTASVVRAGRANSLINRWRRLALSPAVDQDEMLSDFFNPLTKSVDELKEYAFKLFEGLMLITTFRIDETVLRCFIDTLAGKYRPVAYHSFYHGFDVALNSYCLIRKTSVLDVIKEFEALSLMVAALGHDADHPGNDNQFEIDSNSPLALCYNDISVLENHHASTTFSVLRMAGCNILKDLSASARASVRTAIVRCILATDMKHHSRLISDLAVIRDVGDFEQVTDGRQLMMNMIIHGADLSSVAHPLPISIKWVEMVCQEFADQAAKSAALGIFVPPHILNLDDEVVRCRLQVNFIDYLVAPLWSAIGGILPEAKPTLEYLRANRDYFFENAGQMSARRASSMPQAKYDFDTKRAVVVVHRVFHEAQEPLLPPEATPIIGVSLKSHVTLLVGTKCPKSSKRSFILLTFVYSSMWGITVGALLVATGVVLVIHGSLSLDAAHERHNTLLYSTVPLPSSLAASLSTTTTTAPATISTTTPRNDGATQSFLSSASFAFSMDAPVYTSFYLFNLTNGEQVLSGIEAPRVQQIGPYVYEKRSHKINVQFQTTPFPSATRNPIETSSVSLSYGYVSYQVVSSYFFSPKSSNGSESDLVVTVNATYARKLQKLRARGYSERFMVAEFAQQHLTEYNRHLRDEFVADAKLRAWTQFLPGMVQQVNEQVLPAVIRRQRQRVDSASIPANLVRMHALARTESIPRVLEDIYRDIADQFLPEILQSNLGTAKRQALPRVLDNLYQRLKVESVPYWLDKQFTSQQLRHVPMALSSLAMKINSIAFPYVLKEVYDRACLEAVPSILRTIKSEIVARDITDNRVQADTAHRNVVENWRKQSSTLTDFDAWLDDTPTGTPRTGFELLPTSASLQLSVEAATLILGSKVSNKRFSIVDYDTQTVATYPLDQPSATAEGFAIWKQVIEMNEAAITYVLQGVNNDVALVGDFLTRAQLLFIRQYLIAWAQSDIAQRDRERYWRQGYSKRTANSDINEPSVDLDAERTGVQTGFKLQPSGASTSGVTAAIAQQLWSAESEFSFVNPQGYTKWVSAIGGTQSSIQALQTGISGLTTPQITEVGAWIQGLLSDGFVKRRAQRHWSDGTCNSVLGVPLTSCLLYDLEPSIAGSQVGFEMNPSSTQEWKVTQALRETLWDQTSSASFLVSTHMSDTALGFGVWLRGIRTSQFARVASDLNLPSVTAVQIQAIAGWLEKWSKNDLNVLNVYNWWRTSTCWDRETLSVTSLNTMTTSNLQTCTESYSEVERVSTLRTSSSQSPYFTFEKDYSVAKTVCDLDAVTTTYTKRASTYDTVMKVYSCDAISTSLSDDVDEATTGFELMPSATSAGDRISLAAAVALWDSANAFSFVNLDGYRKWYTTDSTTADGISMLQLINDGIDAACLKILGGGEGSAVFNDTLAAVSCERMAKTHFDNVQAWVRAQSSSKWLQNALLDQWRRGAAEELEIEPYRSTIQRGWELAVGCETSQCVLSGDNGTVYKVPRDALGLWDASSSGSFLTDAGMRLWTTLSAANASADSAAVGTAKNAIVAATQAATWETWMQRVFEWLEAWVQSEHLLRDVLGHWLYAQCPTASRFVSLVQKSPDVVTTVTVCPPVASQYTVTLSDTIVDLQAAASRPRDYFKADIVETSAKVQPKKIVQVTESWTSCEVLGSGSVKQTVASQTSLKEFQACNFLSVMADATILTNAGSPGFQPLAVVPAEATFEMNLSTTTSVSIEIAKLMWNQSTSFTFTNLTVFREKWYRAINQASFLEAMAVDLAKETQTQTPSDLTPVQSYLKAWETCSIATRRVGIAWLSQSGSMIDLDSNTDGVQSGFELFPSGAWKQAVAATTSGGSASGALPSFDQGLYVWRAANTFSFLNANGTLTADGLPTGFSAWKEIYQGVDYASEQLVSTYPPEATVQRQATMQYSLSVDQRAALLAQMVTQTTLTEPQLRGIAGWLMDWSTNAVLRDYVLNQWAVGATPRGESGVTFNLANHMTRLFQFTNSSGVAPDLFTVASPLLTSLSTASRRDLWDVTKAGSLVNPTTQIVWCTVVLNGDSSRYCPSIVDDFGVITQPALDTFKAVVQASVPTQEAITKSANLTRLSLMFLQAQFDITDEQTVMTIASWWQQTPDKSAFFQANQLRTWRSNATSVSKDPLRFGFDLGFVFPVNTNVFRNASASDLVVNTVDLGGGSQSASPLSACSESLEFLYSLWDSTNSVSFLHLDGVQQWRRYLKSETDDAAFRAFIDAAESPTAAIIKTAKMTSTDVTCALQATRHWLASWQQHPNLHQFVEFLWLQPLNATTSSSLTSPLLQGASDLLRAFPLDATTLSDGVIPTTSSSDKSLELWANLTLVVLDPSQPASLVNATTGSPVWRSLLVNCFSSDSTSGTCRNSSLRSKEVYQFQVSTAKVALHLLADTLSNTTRLDAGSLKLMINARAVPWMIAWLDHPLFEEFVLQHVQDVEPGLKSQATSFWDFAMAQFVTGAVTRVSYTIPTVLGISTATGAVKTDAGVASERFLRQQLAFDPILKVPSLQNATFLPGFGELKAFCDSNSQDVAFAYDTSTECKLNTDYSVSIKEASALIALFSDTTPWEWTKMSTEPVFSAPQSSTRAALLIDAFLAQPFSSNRECEFLVENVAAAYKLSAEEKRQACVQETSGIYLQLAMLSDSGFASKPRRYTTDFQAYLRYAATKFVYEPCVLGLQANTLLSGASSSASPSPLVYPVGGYLAAANISRVLFGSNTSSQLSHGIWTNESITNGQRSSLSSGALPPQVLTLQAPLLNDSALFVKKSHVIGELLAIDNATEVTIWGEKVSLSAVHVTDGSQFTTAILAQKLSSGGGAADFPLPKLMFYWTYAQRFVQAEFVRNVTRFGVPLMRYSVSSWLNPMTLPSGVSTGSASIPGDSPPRLNMSLLADSLQLGLSGTTSEAGDPSPPETSIDVDPLTGVVYHQRLVWQLSALVTHDPANNDVWHKNLRECWLPLVWVQEQASVSSSNGLSLAQVVKSGPFAREKVAIWELASGIVYVVVGVALTSFYARRQRMLYLHHIRSVRPEQTVCLLLEDEASSLVSPSPTSKPPMKSSGVKDTKLGLRHRENSTEVEPASQSLFPLASGSSSNSSAGSSVSGGENTRKEEQLVCMNTLSSGGSRSGRKKTQPRIQTIVEHTDGVGDGLESNSDRPAKHFVTSTST